LWVEFDPQCSTERRHDPLCIMDGTGRVVGVRSGREASDWESDIRVGGEDLLWKFTSDSSVNGWGFRFKVHAIMPISGPEGRSTDRKILSRPSMDMVISLLDADLLTKSTTEKQREIMFRLAAALASAAQVSNLNSNQRMWALQKLRKVIRSLTREDSSSPPAAELPVPFFTICKGLAGLPDLLLRQYEYEEPILRTGKHLMFSPFLKVFFLILTIAFGKRSCKQIRVISAKLASD